MVGSICRFDGRLRTLLSRYSPLDDRVSTRLKQMIQFKQGRGETREMLKRRHSRNWQILVGPMPIQGFTAIPRSAGTGVYIAPFE